MPAQNKKRAAHSAIVKRVLEGDGMASRTDRRAAFYNTGLSGPIDTLLSKVATQPARITDGDIEAVIASGHNEDQIFELVICAAIGQSSRQYETAFNALATALSDKKGR